LRGDQTPAALRYLISQDDLVCARLVNDPMDRKITVEELEKHNRIPSSEEWREKSTSWEGECGFGCPLLRNTIRGSKWFMM
jgi:hypothetical protein